MDDDISSDENIGWVVKHSDLMNVFFQEIDNYENIFFITPQRLLRKKIIFYYQFFSTGDQTNNFWLLLCVAFFLYIIWGPILESSRKNLQIRKYKFFSIN